MKDEITGQRQGVTLTPTLKGAERAGSPGYLGQNLAFDTKRIEDEG